jgi:glycosyltransferase involved in cell wall biosynthesis
LALSRLTTQIQKAEAEFAHKTFSFEELLSHLEMPSSLRELLGTNAKPKSFSKRYRKTRLSLGNAFDAVSFPVIASGIVLAAAFASAKVLHKDRELLVQLAKRFPRLNPPRRILWLTDTFGDKNGVARVLEQVWEYAKSSNLPIDILVCQKDLKTGANLIAIKPMSEFTLSLYPQQPFRVPDILEIQDIFEQGSYTHIVCSTEGPMMAAALFLKHAHNVPVHFFVHTDWMAFARDSLKLAEPERDRVRRILRFVYGQFDSLLVLNSEQKGIFSGSEFQIPAHKIHQTAHWAEATFRLLPQNNTRNLKAPILLFAGRISAEKGVFELPEILNAAKAVEQNVRFVVAGTGPDESALRKAMPDAEFLGWQSTEQLCALYNEATLLVLPSRFDTFGCVILEAMACGLPVAAFRCKGPADIIEHNADGFLSENNLEMSIQVSRFLASREKQFETMSANAIKKARQYSPKNIMNSLLEFVTRE